MLFSRSERVGLAHFTYCCILISGIELLPKGSASHSYARLPLPSVDNRLIPDLVWVSALLQSTGPYVDLECPVPRWRLAREGPFLEERSPESIRSLGPGCAFRNTTYHASDYAAPVGDYGFPLHHPRFVEWIGVPQSAGLIQFSGSQWVDKLSRDQAVTAAVHL